MVYIKKITKIINDIDGTTIKEVLEIDESDYEIMSRVWATSDGEIIREWTADEYIKCDPNQTVILPALIGDRKINVEAHCVEVRNIYAIKNGKRIACYLDNVIYPIKSSWLT